MQICLGIVYNKSGAKSVSLSVGFMAINNAKIYTDIHTHVPTNSVHLSIS
jgi:hypothetical protein